MGEVLAFKRPRPGDKAKGKTLCRHGFHKWQIEQAQRFDTKQGRLITRYRCQRCDAVKTEAH